MAPNNKSLVLVAALLLVAAVGQVRCGALMIPSLLGLPPIANVTGIVTGVLPCSIGSAINVAAVPPFANATVQLVCNGTVVANATTDASGAFVINLSNVLSLVPAVLNPLLGGQCKVVASTPLVACNVSLAGVTGTLAAPLQPLGGGTIGGLLSSLPGTVVGTINGTLVMVLGGVLNILTGAFSVA
ncbi:unnamed protein product [Urochloa decumbens]|uniref:Uncharacterized protein n=1 Tax=Urochloa decumbens TaxID=240449 RepID=A0ABC8X8G7_9POAL